MWFNEEALGDEGLLSSVWFLEILFCKAARFIDNNRCAVYTGYIKTGFLTIQALRVAVSLVFWLIFANIDQTAKAGGSLIISITRICLKSGHTPCLGNVNIC